MGRLWLMVRKDLLRQVRSPLGMSLVLAFPLVFSALLALTFGTGGDRVPRVRLLVENRDGEFLSSVLLSAFSSEQMGKFFDVSDVGEQGREMMEQGEASALLIIPAGFSRDLLDGTPVVLQLVRNPAEGILPEIAEQTLTVLTDGLDSGSRLLRGPLEEIASFVESEGEGVSADRVSAVAVAIHGIIEGAWDMLLPPAITLESVQLQDEPDTGGSGTGNGVASIFLFVLPGISVWALFMVGDIAMRDLLIEQTDGTLQRQLSGPISPFGVIAGKALFTAVMAAISLVILSGIGWFASSGGVDLAGFAGLSLAIIVAVTGFSAVMYGAMRTQRQGATFSGVLFLVFAFLGGAFFQIDQLPSGVRQFAPLSPFYWGTTGFQELIRDGAGFAEVLPNVGVLTGIGATGLLIGSSLLRRKIGRGGAA